jgi:hypothetical protein
MSDVEVDSFRTQDDVARRATLLCLRAEPHADGSPCASHVAEANRQLYGIAV